jgi:hypothetical protein
MKIDKNCLKKLILAAKENDIQVNHVLPCEKQSYPEMKKNIEKFIDKKHDYIVIVIRKC